MTTTSTTKISTLISYQPRWGGERVSYETRLFTAEEMEEKLEEMGQKGKLSWATITPKGGETRYLYFDRYHF